MFGKGLRLFSVFGFDVKIDPSWLIVVVLIVWSLAVGIFPGLYGGLSRSAYWAMGITGALGLFISILAHEFCHSIVARRYGIPIKGITLFVFGGVAEMEDEPESARAEFMMAVAGPLSSVAIGIAFYVVHAVATRLGWSTPVNGVIRYLYFINGLLAAFNLLPAFPLDGGRILRSILWSVKDNLRWATGVSSRIGSGFGYFFIAYGLFNMLLGSLIAGVWYFVIGLFLQQAASTSYQQVLTRKALEGLRVRRFMNADPITVPPSISIQEFIDDYVYRYDFDMFPVVERDRLLGCVTLSNVRGVDRQRWPIESLEKVMERCASEASVGPDDDATKALAVMNRTGSGRLLVTQQGRLVGIITLKDLLRFLALKVQFEEA